MDFEALQNVTLWPLNGRHIVHTTSSRVFWVMKGKDKCFPLLPQAGASGEPVVFILEAPESFLAVDRSNDVQTHIEQVGPFHRFEVCPINFLSPLE